MGNWECSITIQDYTKLHCDCNIGVMVNHIKEESVAGPLRDVLWKSVQQVVQPQEYLSRVLRVHHSHVLVVACQLVVPKNAGIRLFSTFVKNAVFRVLRGVFSG